jgi:hypothetical protein
VFSDTSHINAAKAAALLGCTRNKVQTHALRGRLRYVEYLGS